MALTKPMLSRIIELHALINSKMYPNTSTIADKMEVSTATVSRDIRFLKYELKAPLDFDRNRNGYYYTKPYELCFNCMAF